MRNSHLDQLFANRFRKVHETMRADGNRSQHTRNAAYMQTDTIRERNVLHSQKRKHWNETNDECRFGSNRRNEVQNGLDNWHTHTYTRESEYVPRSTWLALAHSSRMAKSCRFSTCHAHCSLQRLCSLIRAQSNGNKMLREHSFSQKLQQMHEWVLVFTPSFD